MDFSHRADLRDEELVRSPEVVSRKVRYGEVLGDADLPGFVQAFSREQMGKVLTDSSLDESSRALPFLRRFADEYELASEVIRSLSFLDASDVQMPSLDLCLESFLEALLYDQQRMLGLNEFRHPMMFLIPMFASTGAGMRRIVDAWQRQHQTELAIHQRFWYRWGLDHQYLREVTGWNMLVVEGALEGVPENINNGRRVQLQEYAYSSRLSIHQKGLQVMDPLSYLLLSFRMERQGQSLDQNTPSLVYDSGALTAHLEDWVCLGSSRQGFGPSFDPIGWAYSTRPLRTRGQVVVSVREG